MLGKLLKHEFKVTSRYFIPMYITVGVMTVLLKLSFLFSGDSIFMSLGESTFMSIIQGLLIAVYVLAIAGTCVLAIFFLIRRFYTNMFGDSGYLMHTLPVTGGQLLNSKLICAFLWMLSLIPVGLLSFFVLFAGTDTFGDIRFMWSLLTEHFYILRISGFSVGWTLVEVIVYVLLTLLCSLLCYYLAITLGQHFMGERRLLGAILFYFLLSIISSAINSVLTNLVERGIQISMASSYTGILLRAVNMGIAMGIVTDLIMIIASYLIIRYLLDKRLNLY